jgi:hypothetical protein
MSFLGCPHRYVLDKQSGGGNESAKVGILFHKLAELYYTGRLGSVALAYEAGPNDPDWLEALRLFSAYRKRYPANEWEVDGCEIPLKAENEIRYGVPEFTGRADMCVSVGPEHVERLRRTRQLDLAPGRYLIDHKVKGQRSETISIEYELQFNAYMMLLEEMGKPVLGTIANVIIRHKEMDMTRGKPDPGKSFMSLFTPPPTDAKRQYVKSSLAKALAMRDTFGTDKNPRDCFSYMKICPHLESGICDRTPSGNYTERRNSGLDQPLVNLGSRPQDGQDSHGGDHQ